MAIPPWKLNLKPASFRGAQFHIDVDARTSGRRTALHEFPKKDIPYAEDMGRRAKRFTVVAYLIGPFYQVERDALIEALEVEGSGQLVHPTYTDVDSVVVETYVATERRERGGYVEIEMMFVEAGQSVSQQLQPDTPGVVTNSVNSAVPTASANFGNDFSGSADISRLG
jgi:prophage DNA circulation protein